MHGIDEFLQWNWARIVFVEYLKYAFGEKWLQNNRKQMKTLQRSKEKKQVLN